MTTVSIPTIAIDGPAGAGKSTVARELAKRLGFLLLDTGAIYRSLAWLALNENIPLDDENALAKRAKNLSIKFVQTPTATQILIEDKNRTDLIRTLEVAQATSILAKHAAVREALLPLQRRLAAEGPCVVEGRDIGTVVLPSASLKFFLTASPEIRAKRRFNELKKQGQFVDLDNVLKEQEERDFRDTHRLAAPTQQAVDALLIDTSDLSLNEVIDSLEKICRTKLGVDLLQDMNFQVKIKR